MDAFTMKSDRTRLAQRKRPAYREAAREWQQGIDPISRFKLGKSPVIDHCHETGYCRAVLNQNTNIFEGKLNQTLSLSELQRHEWTAALFNRDTRIIDEVTTLIYESWPNHANPVFVWEIIKRMAVYYSAVWEAMGQIKYEIPKCL